MEKQESVEKDAKPHMVTILPVTGDISVAKLNVPPSGRFAPPDNQKESTGVSTTAAPRMFVMLDRSGSMGDSVSRLVRRILPEVCRNLSLADDAKVTLITFDSEVETMRMTISRMQDSNVSCRGATYMAKAFKALSDEVLRLDAGTPVRLLALSDGALHDQDETCRASSRCTAVVRDHAVVNSQAIRFFTSYADPDTRGLASVLSLNSAATKANLVDLNASLSDAEIVDAIVNLFKGDGLGSSCVLKCDNAALTKDPWDASPSDSLRLRAGENYVWFKAPPQKLRVIDGSPTSETKQITPIHVEAGRRVTLADTFGSLKPLMDSYLSRLRVLKVVKTEDTLATIDRMLVFFEQLETQLIQGEMEEKEAEDLKVNHSLANRVKYLCAVVKSRRRSFLTRMREIANDEKVSQLNAAQQADYLRTNEDQSRNDKDLARRALSSGDGLEFAKALHGEVRAMREHLDAELGSLFESDAEVPASFYSMETTLGGIRALCSIGDSELSEMEATDILQLANIVGVPCVAPIANYVDPMVWHVDKVLSGTYLSLSDVLVAHMQSEGGTLTAPGHPNDVITNVIPVFVGEHGERVYKFLRKHARKLLEYTASIGMRRMIAEVPLTYAYTVAAGVSKMCEVVTEATTEANVRTLCVLAKNLHSVLYGKFNYVLDLIAATKDASTESVYLAYNGMTNLIDPILQLVSTPESGILKTVDGKYANIKDKIPAVLRSLYSHETYMVLKKMIKYDSEDDEDAEDYVKRTLWKLLGVEDGLTDVQPLFTSEPEEVKFDDERSVDRATFDDMKRRFSFINRVAVLPATLAVVTAEDPVGRARDTLRPVSPKVMCEAFGLGSSHAQEGFEKTLDDFILANIVQGLLERTKKTRQDDDQKVMNIPDLKSLDVCRATVRKYVLAERKRRYEEDVASKKIEERKTLLDELVDRLLKSEAIDEFCDLLKNGITRGGVSDTIDNIDHKGYARLSDALCGLSDSVDVKEIPLRTEKLVTMGVARDENESIVFNDGNCVLKLIQEVESIYADTKTEEEINAFRDRYRKYGVEGLHIGLVPDVVDEYGRLPRLQCGFSSCAKKFDDEWDLWEHVLARSNARQSWQSTERVYVVGLHQRGRAIFSKQEKEKNFDEDEFVKECDKVMKYSVQWRFKIQARTLFKQLKAGYDKRSAKGEE